MIFDQRGKYQLNLNFKENGHKMLVLWKFEGFNHDSKINIVPLIISAWKVCITVNSIIATTSCKQPTSISNHFENNHLVS